MVKGTEAGGTVEIWFKGGGKNSESFTYEVVSDTNNEVLVVAAEGYTGASPVYAGGPNYLDYYLDALEANGVDADVYDVDARGRTPPDHLGVLSHYDALVHPDGTTTSFETDLGGWQIAGPRRAAVRMRTTGSARTRPDSR